MLLRLWGAQCSKRLNKGHRVSQPITGRIKMQGEKFLVCWIDVFYQANHWSMTDCLLLAVSVPWPWPCPTWACFIFRDFWLLEKKFGMQSVDVTCPQETAPCRHRRELPILKSHWLQSIFTWSSMAVSLFVLRPCPEGMAVKESAWRHLVFLTSVNHFFMA